MPFWASSTLSPAAPNGRRRLWPRGRRGDFGSYSGSAGFAAGDVNRQVRGSVFFQNRGGETLTFPEFADAGASPTVNADGEQAMNASLVAHWDGAFAQVRAYRKLRELPGAPYDSNIDDTNNHNIDEMVMGEAGYTKDVGDFTLTGRVYLNRYEFSDYFIYEPASSNFHDYGDSTWLGAELRAHWKILPKDRLGLTVGGEGTLDWVESHSYDTDDDLVNVKIPSDFNIEGIYAELNGNATDWASFSAGLRYDRNSDWQNKLSPRVALLFHKDEDYGLKLLYAQGFRNPSPLEAFFADGMTFIANPDLKPETIESFEAVLWARPIPGLNVRLSAFRWDLNDILELVSVPQDGVDFKQYQNLTTITSTGLEAEASYRDTAGWYGFATATLSIVEENGSEADALNAPEWDATGGVSTPKLWDLFHVSTELQFLGSRHTRDPLDDSPAFLRWNATIYLPSWNKLDFTLGVRNIIGVREQIPAQIDYDRGDPQTPGYVPVYTIPGEGREIYARVGYSY